jgi:hypothetical protein
MKRTIGIVVAVVALVCWTWGLLEPRPVPEGVRDEFTYDEWKVISKTAHAGVYTLLTVLCASLMLSRRGRRVVVGLLMLHGACTELAQYLMDVGRTGQVSDVLIDWAGIGVGVVVLRWWEKRTIPPGEPPPVATGGLCPHPPGRRS